MTDRKKDWAADAAIMRRIRKGDQSAYKLVVERHLPQVMGLANRILNDRSLAEDVAQEAFTRLWQQAETWRPDGKIGTWLHRVVYNLCIDENRRSKPALVAELPEVPDFETPESHREKEDISRSVQGAIAALPIRQRVAITLVHHQGFSNGDAATIMDVSTEALESLLARGRRTLKQKLIGKKADLL